MTSRIPKATHIGKLALGSGVPSIPCAVLDNGVRVISESGIATAFKSRSGASKRMKKAEADAGALLPVFLASKGLLPFISKELRDGPLVPIQYEDLRGNIVTGYDATVLPKVCDVWLAARQAGALHPQQAVKAMQAECIVRALANVGIVALVDEATGYQAEREKNALEKLLSVYLTEERLKWAKAFPTSFYKEIYRLNNWNWPPANASRRPGVVGKYTNDIVYERLPHGVLDRLKEINPTDAITKRRKHKHHQFLSLDVGHPDLQAHIIQVVGIMRAALTWREFLKLLDRSLPKGNAVQLDFLDEM